MEAGALSGPSPGLEKIVLGLIPPAARESVAGDLWEMYRGPWQYLRDALGAVVFIVVSQARRNLNPPVLALKGVLLFSLLEGFSIGPLLAAIVTAAALTLLALAGAYQTGGRPSPRLAMVEAVLAAGGAAEVMGLMVAHAIKPNWAEAPYFIFLGPWMVPFLCMLRPAVILWGDRGHRPLIQEMTLAEVRADYRRFERRVAKHNALEILALGGAVLIFARMPLGATIYLRGALSLGGRGVAVPAPEHANFAAMRALFQEQLARQHRVRCFVWWLWFLPLVLALQAGFSAARPLSLVTGLAAALLFGFFIESLNRERRGRVQEEIGGLALAVERTAQ